MTMKVSEVITIDKSDVHVKWQGQRSEVKVTEVKKLPLFVCFLALIRIHRLLRNDAKSPNGLKRCALLFSKFTHQSSRSHGPQNWRFLPELSIFGLYLWIHRWPRNDTQSLKGTQRCAPLFFQVIRQIWRKAGTEKSTIWFRFGRFRIPNAIWIHGYTWNVTHSV